MPILIVVTVIVQASFIFHVIRTGRPYWWAFIILSFPVAGCVIYYFVEIFPGSREHRSARKTMHGIARALEPDAELKRRMQELEICGSVENKSNLAQECMHAGMFDDAVRLYVSCLSGVHSDDAQLLFNLADAHLHAGRPEEAAPLLDRLMRDHAGFRRADVELLRARMLEELGQTEQALQAYEELIPVFVGLEARCRYASLLQAIGHETQARFVFREVADYAARMRISHDAERQWADLARRNAQEAS
jgi:hypothetical protein